MLSVSTKNERAEKMSAEIDIVVAAIEKAGGKCRPMDVIGQLEKRLGGRRNSQKAIQAALDRGVVYLDSDMQLTARHTVHQAA
jgi:hypothetical protein